MSIPAGDSSNDGKTTVITIPNDFAGSSVTLVHTGDNTDYLHAITVEYGEGSTQPPAESQGVNWTATDYVPSGTAVDKTAQAAGQLGGITISGTGATWRVSNGAYYCLELGKAANGCASFTLSSAATVTIVAASTGSKNTSDAILSTSTSETDAIAEKNGATTVTGSDPQTTLVYENVPAGTYYFGAFPASSNGRGIRLYSIVAE